MLLTDDQYRFLVHSIPDLFPGTNPSGASSFQQRIILECVLWKLASRIPWSQFPAAYFSAFSPANSMSSFPDPPPSSRQVYRRCHYWRSHGLLLKILSALAQDLKTTLGLDLASVLSQGLVRFECLPGRSWRVSLDRPGYQPRVMFTAFLVLTILARGVVTGSFDYLSFPSRRVPVSLFL